MSDEKKDMGAPSSDDTRALFVTARKKQLADQEEQRKREEEEQKRREAELEVRRLEAEVQARKEAAENEARRIEEERIRMAQQAQTAPIPSETGQPATSVSKAATNVGQAFGGMIGGVAQAAKTVTAQAAEVAKAKTATQPIDQQPATTQPMPTVTSQPTPPVAPQPAPTITTQPAPPVAAQPTPTITTQPAPPVVAQPAPPVAPQPTPTVAPQPTPTVAPQPAPPVAPQPTPTVTTQPAPPVAAQPAPPVAPQPTPTVATQTAPPVAAQPTPQVTPQPAAPSSTTIQNDAPAKKPNVKLFAIIGAVVVVVVVLLVFVLPRAGGGGGSTSKLFAVSYNEYLSMSADDQASFVGQAQKFFDGEGLVSDFVDYPAEDQWQVEETIIKIIRDAALLADEYDNPLFDAGGTPMFLVSMYYAGGMENMNDYLLKYTKYKQPSYEELEQMNLIDYSRIEGNDLVGVLLTADAYLTELGFAPMDLEKNNAFSASYTMNDTFRLMVDQSVATATQPFGVIAGYGYMVMDGSIDETLNNLTGIGYGAFVRVPSVDDELNDYQLLTAFGYAIPYNNETFSVTDNDRDYAYFRATTEAEHGRIVIGMIDEAPSADGNYEPQLNAAANWWLDRVIGENSELMEATSNYEYGDDDIPRYTLEGFIVGDENDALNITIYAGFHGQKPCVVITVSDPNRTDVYRSIGRQMYDYMEQV